MNWFWKLLGYTDEDKKYAKSIVGKYHLEQAKEFFAKKDATREEAQKIADEIMRMTNEDINVKEKSQKQNEQIRSYKNALRSSKKTKSEKEI
tara:strand:- start:2724 stop:2999 length:276 start_codon:yes stop_codon:yes gene_type:complete